jgi:hypothetical protein
VRRTLGGSNDHRLAEERGASAPERVNDFETGPGCI